MQLPITLNSFKSFKFADWNDVGISKHYWNFILIKGYHRKKIVSMKHEILCTLIWCNILSKKFKDLQNTEEKKIFFFFSVTF